MALLIKFALSLCQLLLPGPGRAFQINRIDSGRSNSIAPIIYIEEIRPFIADDDGNMLPSNRALGKLQAK